MHLLAAGAVSAATLFVKENASRKIISFCSAIDEMLGGGVAAGQITEFCTSSTMAAVLWADLLVCWLLAVSCTDAEALQVLQAALQQWERHSSGEPCLLMVIVLVG